MRGNPVLVETRATADRSAIDSIEGKKHDVRGESKLVSTLLFVPRLLRTIVRELIVGISTLITGIVVMGGIGSGIGAFIGAIAGAFKWAAAGFAIGALSTTFVPAFLLGSLVGAALFLFVGLTAGIGFENEPDIRRFVKKNITREKTA